MTLQETAAKLKGQGFLDDKELFAFGRYVVADGKGAAANLILLSIAGETVNLFYGTLQNDYTTKFLSAKLTDLEGVKVGAKLFGAQVQIAFTYKGDRKTFRFKDKKVAEPFKPLAVKGKVK